MLKIRNITFGEGAPKICIPIMGKTLEALKEEIEGLKELPYDVIEWRNDHFDAIENIDEVIKAVTLIRELLGDTVLLSTFRTAKEGGQKQISDEYYVALNKAIIESGKTDLVDVECFSGDALVKELVDFAHANHVAIVMSNHDFSATPSYEEIVRRLTLMDTMGADIPKIALMPQSKEDVLTVLCATNTVAQKINKPIITMSMSATGVVSRLVGEAFGSCLTFGAAKVASAPGQINAKDLKTVLDIIHNSL